MKRYDIGSSLFWLLFSLLILVESLRLGIGTLRNPGMGLMPFGASGVLGILSLIVLLQSFWKKEESPWVPLFSGVLWKRILIVMMVLILYIRVMPFFGYLISTFLLMSFLFWIVRGQRWWWVLISSLLVSSISYYVFSIKLNCQFPEGLFAP
jgi:hypothetical protein